MLLDMNIVSITDSLGECRRLVNATFNLAISTAAHLPQDNNHTLK